MWKKIDKTKNLEPLRRRFSHDIKTFFFSGYHDTWSQIRSIVLFLEFPSARRHRCMKYRFFFGSTVSIFLPFMSYKRQSIRSNPISYKLSSVNDSSTYVHERFYFVLCADTFHEDIVPYKVVPPTKTIPMK